jgi:hypothetical protein
MRDFRTLFPTQIIRGALLRPDGIAVGLISGGAPPEIADPRAARDQAGSDYHRLLLACDAPLHVYQVDQPPDLAAAIGTLFERQAEIDHSLLGTVVSEMADYLTELAQQSGSRAKQVIWAVTASGNASARAISGMDLSSLIGRGTRGKTADARRSRTAPAALAQAVEQARRLADSLSQLGGTPAPRLMEAEEIARLIYGLADPVRAQRYPLGGTLLDRVRRVVAPAQAIARSKG